MPTLEKTRDNIRVNSVVTRVVVPESEDEQGRQANDRMY